MEDSHQIKTIHEALSKEKEKWLFELAKINLAIERKQSLIDKMLLYQKEYDAKGKLEVSKSIPMLHNNLNLFYKKILEALFNAECELEKLTYSKNSIFEKIQTIDKKAQVLAIFQERIKTNEELAAQRLEQILMSDLTMNKFLRGSHD